MEKIKNKSFIIIGVFGLLIMSLFYLIGFIQGYTSNSTEHKFIFDIGLDTKELMKSLENHTLMHHSENKTCMEGCYYAFRGIVSGNDVFAIGNFNINNCNEYCKKSDNNLEV